MKNQMGSSRMDTVLKMLLIAFISLLAFSSGVYFGKQLSDSDYQLKALESDFSSKGTKQAAHETEENPEDAINEEEVAALSEKWVSSEKEEAAEGGHGDARSVASHDDHGAKADAGHGDDHGTAKADAHGAKADAHAAPAAKTAKTETKKEAPKAVAKNAHGDEHGDAHAAPTSKPDLSAAHKAANRVANNASPVENAKPAKESRVPTSLPKTVGASADVVFTVQVASYPTADAAKEHAGELVKKGFPAFPVEANVNGKTWYRVSVGSFKSMKEATSYRAQLLKQSDLPSAIVQRIQR